MNEIEVITISPPLSSLTEDEQISLLAVYVREMVNSSDVLLTAINTDKEKINFTYSVDVTGDIHDQVEQFTDVTMGLVEKVQQETKSQQKLIHQPTRLSIPQRLKNREQILTIRNAGKYNVFYVPTVRHEAYENV